MRVWKQEETKSDDFARIVGTVVADEAIQYSLVGWKSVLSFIYQHILDAYVMGAD